MIKRPPPEPPPCILSRSAMNPVPLNPLSFDRGLYAISELRPGEVTPALPQEGSVSPSGASLTNHLNELIADLSLKQGLLDAIRPKLADLSILLPQNFSALLSEVRSLTEAAGNGEVDRNSRQRLEELAGLLREELALLDQLNQARSQLLQA